MSKELIEIHLHYKDDTKNKILYCDKGNLFNTLYVVNKECSSLKIIKDILTADYNVQNSNCIIVITEEGDD